MPTYVYNYGGGGGGGRGGGGNRGGGKAPNRNSKYILSYDTN